MLTRLKYAVIKHIRENSILYLVFLILFSLGIGLGAFWVRNLSVESKDLLIRYLNGFFSLIPGGTLSNGSIFKTSFINNIVPAVLLFIFGFTYLGIVFSSLYIIFKGFCFGFSVAFLVAGYGSNGLLFSLVSLLPHSIILIPGTIFLCAVCLQFSLYLLKYRNDKRYENRRQNLISYSASFTVGLIAIILASLIESYITPVFIRSLSTFII